MQRMTLVAMRPDPYKRARSRIYKAKHGLLPPKSKDSPPEHLPSNSSSRFFDSTSLEEKLDSEFDSETVDFNDFFLNNEHFESPQNDITSYPKELFEEIIPKIQGGDILGDSEKPLCEHACNVLQADSRVFSIRENVFLSIRNETTHLTDSSSSRIAELSLTPPDNRQSMEPKAGPASTRAARLELEEWLDNVL